MRELLEFNESKSKRYKFTFSAVDFCVIYE